MSYYRKGQAEPRSGASPQAIVLGMHPSLQSVLPALRKRLQADFRRKGYAEGGFRPGSGFSRSRHRPA